MTTQPKPFTLIKMTPQWHIMQAHPLAWRELFIPDSATFACKTCHGSVLFGNFDQKEFTVTTLAKMFMFGSYVKARTAAESKAMQAWLLDGYSRIFRSEVIGPSGLKDYGSATLRCKIWSLPFLGLRPHPLTLAQSKERKGSNVAIWQHWEGGRRRKGAFRNLDAEAKPERRRRLRAG